jgi:hypothetical protein
MCHDGVESILVMFDVLDCYILYMCLLLFIYCIPILEAPRPRRQTKHDFFRLVSPDEHVALFSFDYVPLLCSSVTQRI